MGRTPAAAVPETTDALPWERMLASPVMLDQWFGPAQPRADVPAAPAPTTSPAPEPAPPAPARAPLPARLWETLSLAVARLPAARML